MKILIINGPNLNLLGKRDPEKYGRNTLKSIESLLLSTFPDVSFNFYQSNIEGEIVSKIQSTEKEFDALMECKIPKVEVHLSHLAQREDFRQVLITARAVNGYISGFKEISYLSAVFTLQQLLKSNA